MEQSVRIGAALTGAWSAVRWAMARLVLCVISASTVMAQTPADPTAIVWQKGESRNYELQSPGLGVSQRYNAQVGWIDVYAYDLRRKDWKEGTEDPLFAEHFVSTIDEVRYFAQQGSYSDLKVSSPQDMDVAGQRFRTVAFEYAQRGRALRSTTYLTVRNGRLLKYRVSIFAATGLDVETVARQFVENSLRNDPTVNSI